MTRTLKVLPTTHALSMVRIKYCFQWPSPSKRLCNSQYPQHKQDDTFSQSDSHFQKYFHFKVFAISHILSVVTIQLGMRKKQGHLFHKIV